MTKADLIDEVARGSQLSKKDAEVIVQAVLDSIVGSLKGGDKVELRGFGSFRLRETRIGWKQGHNGRKHS